MNWHDITLLLNICFNNSIYLHFVCFCYKDKYLVCINTEIFTELMNLSILKKITFILLSVILCMINSILIRKCYQFFVFLYKYVFFLPYSKTYTPDILHYCQGSQVRTSAYNLHIIYDTLKF